MALGLRRLLARDIRLRFLISAVPTALILGGLVLFVFWLMAQELVRDLGARVAVNQVLLDRARAELPLSRDLVLAETLAGDPALLAWARKPEGMEKRSRAAALLEHYRTSFADKSYFVVPRKSAEFFYASTEEPGEGLGVPEYTLSPENIEDAWFFETMDLPGICHVNIDRDRELLKTKVWFNCNIRDPSTGAVLGVVGSGIDLTEFLTEIQRDQPDGVTAIYIDRRGAIQAHPDASLIIQDSLTKEGDLESTIFDLLDSSEDREALAVAITDAEASPEDAVPTWVSIEGRNHLVGVSYLPRMKWFSVSVMDLRTILFGDYFIPLAALIAFSTILSLGILALTVNNIVLRRIYSLGAQVSAFKDNNTAFVPKVNDKAPDQLNRLQMDFADMAEVVRIHTTQLENLVAERTRELEELAALDSMTGVRNRRSFFEAAEREARRMERMGGTASVAMFDLDRFKTINDSHGHAVGDDVITAFAQVCVEELRDVDIFARLGGEEFAAILLDTPISSATAAAERIREATKSRTFQGAGGSFQCTVSIGLSDWSPDELNLESAMERADAALYRAKHTGRDRVSVYEPSDEARDG